MTNFANKTKKGRKHSNLSIEAQRRGMASTLRMRTTISQPKQWQP